MLLKPRHPWNPGYALPANIRDEPVGRGVIISPDAKRRTISSFNPSEFYAGVGGTLGGLGSIEGNSIGGSSLGCHECGGRCGCGELGGIFGDIGSGIKKGAKGAWKGIKKGAKWAGGAFCKAQGTGMLTNVPYSSLANGLCPGGEAPYTAEEVGASGEMSTTTKVLIGAGILGAAYLLLKR